MKQYIVINTKQRFVDGEYPSGGFEIYLLSAGKELYIDSSPDWDSVSNFVKMASRNSSIQVEYRSAK
jgi:hypothetical protein